jgi:hypothetical protein
VATVEQYSEPFPWRTATLVASAIAAAELVGLIAIGGFVVAHPFHHHANPAAAPAVTVVHHATAVVHRVVAPIPKKDRVGPIASHPLRPRSEVRVLVLNANGVQGAANAPAHHYARSMVMFVPGYLKEARRLAHETGIRLVAPVDGLSSSALSASRLVVLLDS